MSEFISVVEASEESGWSQRRIVALALRDRERLPLWVLPDPGGWVAWPGRRAANGVEVTLNCPVTVAEPVRITPDVARDQLLADGVLRAVSLDGLCLDASSEWLSFAPPRRVPPEVVLVRRLDWASVRAATGAAGSATAIGRAVAIERLSMAVSGAGFEWTPQEAAEAMGVHERTLRRVLAAESRRPTVPAPFAASRGPRGGRRYLLMPSVDVLLAWFSLVREPAAPRRAARPVVVEVERSGPRQPPPAATAPPSAPATSRGSLRDRATKGRAS